MFVVVNPSAGGGRARKRWRRVAPALPYRAEAALGESPSALRDAVAAAIAAGHRTVIAGGGDGTVNAVASAILERGDGERVVLGALGLGSSNDFHKPFGPALAGIPCLIDDATPMRRDVGLLEVLGPDGVRRTRCWLLNASVGVTAEANLRFNRGGGPLRILKRISTSAAIAWAAGAALLAGRPREFVLEIDGAPAETVRAWNLAVVKSPHFAGLLRYDAAGAAPGGGFTLHGLLDVSRAVLLRRLAGLARGRFRGRPGTRSLDAATVTIRGDGPFPIEFDGEVIEAVWARLTMRQGGIRTCA